MSDLELFEGATLQREAGFSDDRTMRFTLKRVWDSTLPMVLWVMLNPSKADERQEDPTIRKCMGFSRRWGYGGVYIGNLFAYVATDPADLREAKRQGKPVCGGIVNEQAILDMAERAEIVVCAWGSERIAKDQAKRIADQLLKHGRPLRALRTAKDGSPYHPLYVSYSRTARPWVPGTEVV